jgi:hypothetical protein
MRNKRNATEVRYGRYVRYAFYRQARKGHQERPRPLNLRPANGRA